MSEPQKPFTVRQKDAVLALDAAMKENFGKPVIASVFALHFWPGKLFKRGNGPWGLGPDGSGRAGGRMLHRLKDLGLAYRTFDGPASVFGLTSAGRALRDTLIAERSDDTNA